MLKEILDFGRDRVRNLCYSLSTVGVVSEHLREEYCD